MRVAKHEKREDATTPVASEDTWVEERDAARRSRTFHGRVRPPNLQDRRTQLAKFLGSYYRDRLRIAPSQQESLALQDLTDVDTLAVEIGHDGQLPSLGVVRMVFKANDVASADDRAVTLYAVGNHNTARARPRNIHFGMPLEGRPPEAVGEPPKVPMGQKRGKLPFWSIPPPKPDELRALEGQIQAFVGHNISHERKAGHTVSQDQKERILDRLSNVFLVLANCAEAVTNFGDWLVRVQHDLFHWMLGDEAGRILFLPMADIQPVIADDLRTLASSSQAVHRIKSELSMEQEGSGEKPYLGEGAPTPFWLHCPSCLRRERIDWTPQASLPFRCPHCGNSVVLDGFNPWPWLMPDVVSFQSALFQVGISGWVVGSRAPYVPVVDRVAVEVFRNEPPPKFLLRSIPTFRGLGDPATGYSRTRLLRALLEIDPEELARALRAPWSEDPRIVGDVFRES